MFEFVNELIAGFSYEKFMRLVIILGGYILIRNLAQRELAKRKLSAQLRDDRKFKSEKNTEQYLEDPKEEEKKEKELEEAAASSFGWGNKTRLRVKKQQKSFEKAVDRLQQQQQNALSIEDEDADIQELLED
ncbi:hypothetical protein TPHA_0F01970 [Tetrapisispora phaffii CBS 4417]|uniref:Processing of GAS1 and ALP protein 2 n=1 Tax=Tetrapisispora phaffii (strain ATCC 24235 / CBS 4417 / NBRC 1672 / NRRL Y-8282 / UCD 70-5) TaxID=1071381 RepID=G8BV97_TETPH|nr:hypothetical protein TPHA_0F01970 [Tetrapisispora phaffii CBS 4417]CCE63679.1 hypothetical protein TPHA_0F01970 [Tetrapisispora phaffii CBS 4417]